MPYAPFLPTPRPNKRKDPVGTNVFYPNVNPVGSAAYFGIALPPPRRVSQTPPSARLFEALANSPAPNLPGLVPTAASRKARRSPPRAPNSLPAPHPSVPPIDPVSVARLKAQSAKSTYSDLPYDPYSTSTEFPFPTSPSTSPVIHHAHGTPVYDLPHFSTLNISTPQQGDRTPFDSPADINIVSPPDVETSLPPSAIFADGAFDSSPVMPPPSVKPKTAVESSINISSIHLANAHRSAGSPSLHPGSPHCNTHRPISPGSIPHRQPSWLVESNNFMRRGSAPQLQNSQVWLPHRPASPLAALQSSPFARPVFIREQSIPEIPSSESIFNYNYSFPPTQPLPPTPVNALDLDLGAEVGHPFFSTSESIVAPEPEQPLHTSEVAHKYLAEKVLPIEFEKRYTVGDELGSGGFGFVCVATQTGFENTPGVEVAVKFVFKAKLANDKSSTIEGEPVESYVLRGLNHPGVIKFIALFEDAEFFYLVSPSKYRFSNLKPLTSLGTRAPRRAMGARTHSRIQGPPPPRYCKHLYSACDAIFAQLQPECVSQFAIHSCAGMFGAQHAYS